MKIDDWMHRHQRDIPHWCLLLALVCLLVAVSSLAKAEGISVGMSCTANWNPSSGATGYRVYVGSTATLKTQKAQVTTTSVQCSALGLTVGQHYMHVTAFNAAGESGASATLPFVVLAIPASPTGLTLE